MYRRDKNISAQLDLKFYAFDRLGLQGSLTCARVSVGQTWMVGLGEAGWGSPLAIGSPRLPTAGPYIYIALFISYN